MSKYSVLLVDDEEEVIQVMLKKIDWEGIGFQVMGYAHNGIEALDLAEQEAPDVVLTDIKMPYMDGLELAHNLKIMYPTVRILIFSGFDEFEYAKEAIRLEVEEYVLKPVDADELRRIFTRIKASLDQEMDEKRNVQKLRDYYMESLPLLQENFYSTLVEGNVKESDIPRFLSDYQIEMDSPMYTAVVIHTSTTQLPEGISAVLLSESVRRLAKERLAPKWNAKMFPHEGNVVMLVLCRSQEDVMRITDDAEAFCRLARHVSQAVVTIGIGKACTLISEIPESYQGAREAVSYRSIYGSGRAINIGEVHDLTKANVQKHCLYLRDHLHFQYARIWNVFSRKLMLTDGSTSGRYNFSVLDQVLEFLLENRMKPFLDFGRRPSMAMNSDGKIVYYEDIYTPFVSRELWEEAFREVLRHIRRKFGKEEVSAWIFELSRDSRHGKMGERCYEDENFDFYEAWRYACRCVKTEIPGAQIGGVSSMIDADFDFLNGFYKRCTQERCIPDFCSYVLFNYTDQYSWENGVVRGFVEKEKSTSLQLDKIRRLMDFTGVGSSKVYFTESNNTIANRDYLNDSCFRAAFFASETMQIHDRADLLCVMAGTDWVSSYLDSGAVIHGGIGLLTKDTIRKPAYFALEFLNRLGSVLIAAGEGYILTRSESGNYYLLCSHFVPFDAGQYPVKADDRPDLSVLHFDGQPSEVLLFRLTGIAEQGYYIVKRRILSSESGSILDEWENFQFSEDLTADDVRYLRERCIPQIRMQKLYVGDNEELSFEVEMRPEDVVLLHIYRE